MALFGSLVRMLAFAICPIVTVIFVSLLCWKRDPVSQPSIVAAIPLGLSSIAILLAQSSSILLRTFNEIATHRAAGMGSVITGLLRAQRPLAWGFFEFTVCLIVIFLVSTFLKHLRDTEAPLIHAYLPLPALIVTALFTIALFLIVFMQYGTVDLVMKIVDVHRNQELTSEYGMVSPAYFAAMISSRLVVIFFASPIEFLFLVVAGLLDLFWRQKQHSRHGFATALTVVTLVACGVSALSEFSFINYLRHVHQRTGAMINGASTRIQITKSDVPGWDNSLQP